MQASRDATYISSASRSEKGENGCPGRRSPPSPRSGSSPIRRSARGAPFRRRGREAQDEGRHDVRSPGRCRAVQEVGHAPGADQGPEDHHDRRARSGRSRSRSSTSTSRSSPTQRSRPSTSTSRRCPLLREDVLDAPERERREHLRRDRHLGLVHEVAQGRDAAGQEVTGRHDAEVPGIRRVEQVMGMPIIVDVRDEGSTTASSSGSSTGSARSTPRSAPTRTTARSAG